MIEPSETVVVSGATGFVGTALTRRLVAAGRRVVAVVRPTSDVAGLRALGLEPLVDAGRAEALTEALAPFGPRTVFHLAARFVAEHRTSDVDDLVATNLGFSTRLAEAATRAGCRRFVAAGTSWQIDASGAERPVSLYAATKAAFEAILSHYAAADGVRVAALRFHDTYGPGDPRRKLLALLLGALASGDRLGLSPGEQRIDLVHVEDVVEALLVAEGRLDAAEAGTFERFAVASGRAVSIRELVGILERVAGRPLPVVFGERPYRRFEVMEPSPGAVLPGWRARISLEEGLSQMIGGAACSR